MDIYSIINKQIGRKKDNNLNFLPCCGLCAEPAAAGNGIYYTEKKV